ncbi:hypothetical protein J2849_001591 [Azospirillum melinis]|nr:hypothetical protein [Azospirillum melinis]
MPPRARTRAMSAGKKPAMLAAASLIAMSERSKT